MANNANVIDELIVKLRLDVSEYQKADAEVNKRVDNTERKAKKVDTDSNKREKERAKRFKESTAAAKTFGNALRGLALTIGGILGVGGGLGGLVGAVISLTNLNTSLNRATVSTGLSKREMLAWGSTARRLGADADAGASALAGLAKEQKQFFQTGNGPTIQAFASMGINAAPGTNLVDILSQAQSIYRQSAPAQKEQIESGLSVQGVSDDLIVMIKSETDVREAYAKSFSEAATINEKAMNAVNDALAGVKNAAIQVANTLATAAKPAIDKFSDWLSKAATEMGNFNGRVQKAGGGLDGFFKVLDEENPQLSKTLKALGDALRVLGETVDIVVYGLKAGAQGLDAAGAWLDKKFGRLTGGPNNQLATAGQSIVDAIAAGWNMLVRDARRGGPAPVGTLTGQGGGVQLTPGAAARIAAGDLNTSKSGKSATGASTQSKGSTSAQEVMQYLIMKHGFTVQQAAAIAASVQGESNFDPTAINKDSGASGLYQLLSKDRVGAFTKRYGTTPDKTSWQTQLDFMATEPSERKRLDLALSGNGGAAVLGERVSRIFEAHGKPAEDNRRAQYAQQLATNYAGQASGPSVNIHGDVTVQANNPQELVGGLQRQSGVANYASGTR